jgi:hypothetical protein
MRGWTLLFKSRVELADTAVTTARLCDGLRQENAALKAVLRERTVLHQRALRDLNLVLQLAPDRKAALALLRDAHTIDLLDEVNR